MINNKLFNFAVEHGMIDESELESLYEEMKNTKYLEKHFGKDFVLNKGKDGRYFTRLPNGKQLRKADKQEFINEIVKYYQREEENKTLRLKDIYDKWIEFKFKYDGISKSSYDRIGEDFERFFLKNPLAQEIAPRRHPVLSRTFSSFHGSCQ